MGCNKRQALYYSLCFFTACVQAPLFSAISATWIDTSPVGDWGVPANWDNNVVPQFVDDVANFSPMIGGPFEVSCETITPTVGTLDSISETQYTFDAIFGNSINFQVSSGTAALLTDRGTAFVNTPITLSSSLLHSRFNPASSTTINGVISGPGGYIKSGAGTIILNNSNLYTGGTTINSGPLSVSSDANLGNASGSLTFNGGQLLTTASFFSARTIIFNSTTSRINTSTSLVTTTLTGTSTGPGTLIKLGSGTLVLMGSNNYTDGTIISNGTLSLSGIGSLYFAGAVSVNSATSIFDVSGITASTTIGDLSGVTDSSVVLGPVNKALVVGTSTPSINFDGVISGLGDFTKQGSGTLILSAMETYTGGTTINNGTLMLVDAGNLSTSSFVNVNSATSIFDISALVGPLTTDINDLSGATGSSVVLGSNGLQFGTANPTLFAGVISGVGGTITKDGTGTVMFAEANTYTGGTNILLGTLKLVGSGALFPQGFLSLNSSSTVFDISMITAPGTTIGALVSSFTGASVVLGNNTLTFGSDILISFGIFAGVISGGGSIVKQGSLPSTFSNFNTYTGGTTINDGALKLIGSAAISNSSFVNVNSPTATFDISGLISSNTTINDLLGVPGSAVVLGGKQLIFGTGNNTTFAGVISGSGGSIMKLGLGTVILTGANTYSGGTTVSAGTLQGDATSLQGNITDNANLVFNQTGAGTYNGSITGSGMLVTEGSGSLNFTGASNLPGLVTVASGTLFMNGSLIGGGTMTVSPGATLGGSGMIAKNVTIQGILSPGNSIGPIFFVGAQTLAPGSTTVIELTPTTADLVDVTGTMTIQPGAALEFIPLPANYTSAVTQTIIHTHNPGGVTGTFSKVFSKFPLFSGQASYTTNDVLLQIMMLPISPFVSSGNAAKVAHCLDSFHPPQGSDLTSVISNLYFVRKVDLNKLQDALLHMQPSQFTALALMQENNTLDVNQGLFNYIETFQPYCGDENKGMNVWMLPFGTRQTQGSNKQNPGYRATTPGVLLGVDGFATHNFLLGGFIGYSHSNLEWTEKSGSANQDTGYASLYGKWGKPHTYLESSLIFGYNSYRTNRHIFFNFLEEFNRHAKGQHYGLQGSFHVKAMGDFKRGLIILSPFVDAGYLYLYEGSFKEHGAQSLNLHVASKSSDLLTTEAGIKLSHCFLTSRAIVTPFLQGSGIYEARFNGAHEKAGFNGCFLNVKGQNPSRALGSLKAGVDSTFADQAYGLSLFYQGRFGQRFNDNAFYAQMNVRF